MSFYHYLIKVLVKLTFLVCGNVEGIEFPRNYIKLTTMFTVFESFVKSCSIECGNDPSRKSGVVHEIKFSSEIPYPTHLCLAQSPSH